MLVLQPDCLLRGLLLCRFCEALSQLSKWSHWELLLCTMFAQLGKIQSFPLFSVLAGVMWMGWAGEEVWDEMRRFG